VPSVAEHTFEMIYSADKLISMFEGVINKDVIFLSIALHDSYKYGLVKSCMSTESRHDRIIADYISLNRKIYLQALDYNDTVLLEKAVRFHAGRWSTNIGDNVYDKLTPEVMFLHTLDMLSAKNLLKVPIIKKEEKLDVKIM
jgi:23S rRNA maturation-related 3'-5' exoribonuclease YhaM